jgi:hypothetical protein
MWWLQGSSPDGQPRWTLRRRPFSLNKVPDTFSAPADKMQLRYFADPPLADKFEEEMVALIRNLLVGPPPEGVPDANDTHRTLPL